MKKLIRAIEVIILIAAAGVLGTRASAYYRSTSLLQEKIDGFRRAAAHPASVIESPLIARPESLLTCTPARPGVRGDREQTLVVMIDSGTPAEEIVAWRSLAERRAWTPSNQLWLVSVSSGSPQITGIDGEGVRRCVIRDPKHFAETTGITQTPTVALFRGTDLLVFVSGVTKAAARAMFERHLDDPATPRPRTPFISDKAGQAIWTEPPSVPAGGPGR